MAESGGIVKWALIAGAVYVGWEYILSPLLHFSTVSTTSTTANTTAATSTTAAAATDSTAAAAAASTAKAAGLTLDAIYQSVVAAMKAAGSDPAISINSGVVSAAPSVFNWYLQNQVIPNEPTAAFAVANMTFDFSSIGDPAGKITAAQWWSAVGPQIGTKLGLSGYGLAGLGAFVLRGRR